MILLIYCSQDILSDIEFIIKKRFASVHLQFKQMHQIWVEVLCTSRNANITIMARQIRAE